jgi:hypothetical protein
METRKSLSEAVRRFVTVFRRHHQTKSIGTGKKAGRSNTTKLLDLSYSATFSLLTTLRASPIHELFKQKNLKIGKTDNFPRFFKIFHTRPDTKSSEKSFPKIFYLDWVVRPK